MDASCINRAILWAMRKVKVCKDIIVLCWKSCRFLFVAAKIHNLRDYFPKPSFLTERNTRFEHNHIKRSCEAFQGLKGHQRRPSIKDPLRPRKKGSNTNPFKCSSCRVDGFLSRIFIGKIRCFHSRIGWMKGGELEKKKAIQKRGSIEFQRGFRSPKNTRTTTLQTLLSP